MPSHKATSRDLGEADDRYTREHWWRFLVLAVGTASREAALRELKYDQIDLRLGRIRLNPEGRRQTKKRRHGANCPDARGRDCVMEQR